MKNIYVGYTIETSPSYFWGETEQEVCNLLDKNVQNDGLLINAQISKDYSKELELWVNSELEKGKIFEIEKYSYKSNITTTYAQNFFSIIEEVGENILHLSFNKEDNSVNFISLLRNIGSVVIKSVNPPSDSLGNFYDGENLVCNSNSLEVYYCDTTYEDINLPDEVKGALEEKGIDGQCELVEFWNFAKREINYGELEINTYSDNFANPIEFNTILKKEIPQLVKIAKEYLG